MEILYLVCLIPPVTVIDDVDEIRNEISQKFNVVESLKRPVHITLYNPVKISSLAEEEKFFSALQNAVYQNPFEQVLRNFGSFQTHTVFIDAEQNESIIKLQSKIKAELKALKIIPAKDVTKFTPHITIAFKDVKPGVHQVIMEAFKDKHFKRRFSVNSFWVYKHMDKKWKPFREFIFKNPDEAPKPLSLFG